MPQQPNSSFKMELPLPLRCSYTTDTKAEPWKSSLFPCCERWLELQQDRETMGCPVLPPQLAIPLLHAGTSFLLVPHSQDTLQNNPGPSPLISLSSIPDKKRVGESVSYPYIQCSFTVPQVLQIWRGSEAQPLLQPDMEMQQQNHPLLHLLSKQGSEGRGNTATLLTCNNQRDTKEGSLEIPLHPVWKEQWNFQSSSHFEPQHDKGMKSSSWKHKQNPDCHRFI